MGLHSNPISSDAMPFSSALASQVTCSGPAVPLAILFCLVLYINKYISNYIKNISFVFVKTATVICFLFRCEKEPINKKVRVNTLQNIFTK